MTTRAQPEELPEELPVLLDAIASELEAYVYFPSTHHAPAVALYAAYTHTAQQFDVAPYLHVYSPELRCGKTLVLDLLLGFAANPVSTANISPAAMYRMIEKRNPTLLFDEVDQVFSRRASDPGAGDLQRILNAGYRRGNPVIRMGGANFRDIEEHEVFGPKVLAGIGNLPLTIADRCIPIRLQRKPHGISKRRFSYTRDLPRLRKYGKQLSKVLGREDLLTRLSQSQPVLPEALHDRAQDIWEPLLALADEVGESWPELAWTSAEALHSGGDQSEGSIGVQLLGDMRRVWLLDREAMTSKELLKELYELDEAPWRELSGRPITARFLAMRLKPYGIYSGNRRIGGIQAKGYRKADLEQAWSQYLPGISEKSSQPSQTVDGRPNSADKDASHERPSAVPMNPGTDGVSFGTKPPTIENPYMEGDGTTGTTGTAH